MSAELSIIIKRFKVKGPVVVKHIQKCSWNLSGFQKYLNKLNASEISIEKTTKYIFNEK